MIAVPLADARDERAFGGKAAQLGAAIRAGLTSFGGTVAPNLPILILMRIGQAASGAVVLPNGDALVRETVSDERRGGRFGLIGSAIGLAAALGPPLGGLLVGTAGWRAMFAVNLLLVGPVLVLGRRCIPHRGVARAAGARVGSRHTSWRSGSSRCSSTRWPTSW